MFLDRSAEWLATDAALGDACLFPEHAIPAHVDARDPMMRRGTMVNATAIWTMRTRRRL